MKLQWRLIFAFIFALLVAIFAVMNVRPTPVNYLLGVTYVPLVLIIIGSAVAGGLIVGLIGIVMQLRLLHHNKQLQGKVADLEIELKKNQPVQEEGQVH